MKKFKVTVNDNTYEVEVEEIGGAPEIKSVQVAAPAPKAAPAPAPKPEPAPKPAPAKAAAPAPAGAGEDVLAPLPGTVISVNVAVGDQVKKDQVLLIFEAMKMENEIVANRDGTITAVYAAKGDVLDAGKPVVALA